MSDHKHTPDRWEWKASLYLGGAYAIDLVEPNGDRISHIADVLGPMGETRDTAHLMAAAPALRDALRDAVALLHTAHKTPWKEHDAALRRFDRDHSEALALADGQEEA